MRPLATNCRRGCPSESPIGNSSGYLPINIQCTNIERRVPLVGLSASADVDDARLRIVRSRTQTSLSTNERLHQVIIHLRPHWRASRQCHPRRPGSLPDARGSLSRVVPGGAAWGIGYGMEKPRGRGGGNVECQMSKDKWGWEGECPAQRDLRVSGGIDDGGPPLLKSCPSPRPCPRGRGRRRGMGEK